MTALDRFDALPPVATSDLRGLWRGSGVPSGHALDGVLDVHDMHIWAMSTTETALTAHLVMPGGYPGDRAIDEIVTRLRHDFKIGHCTLQVEEGRDTLGFGLYLFRT